MSERELDRRQRTIVIKEYIAKKTLVQMVGKRKRLLKYLERTDFESYKQVVATLGLRK